MMKIYLTNLGKYNEGELLGEWVKLPATEEELEAVFERIKISDEPDENGNYYEEYFITDYETDIDGLKIGEYDNLEELNELAETLEGMDENELEVVGVMLEDGCEFDEAIKKTENGDYRIYYDCSNMTDVAYEVIEESGFLNNVSDIVARYFDYEAYGRDLDIEGKFYMTDSGNCIEIF